jgi:hypothetical protein
MKKIALLCITTVIALSPVCTSALAGFPDFPMSFWGKVTINGSDAPAGSVVRAYYGSVLAGTVTTTGTGVYGYTDPTKQKLVIGSGSSTVIFTIQASGFNGGSETGGNTAMIYDGFIAGLTVNKDLAFTVTVPSSSSGGSSGASTNSGSGASSGGSGGGGGGGGGYVVTSPATATSTVSTVATSTNTGTATTTGASTSVSRAGSVLGASTYHFTRNLRLGSAGADVSELQRILASLGYLDTSPTGYFGSLTLNAVKKFQKAHGIESIGVVGPQTRTALATSNTGDIPTATTTGATSTPQSTAVQIAQLQQLLKVLQKQLAQLLAERAGKGM